MRRVRDAWGEGPPGFPVPYCPPPIWQFEERVDRGVPLTMPAVRRSECAADAPPAIPAPFPPLVAAIVPFETLLPEQLVLPNSRQSTGADATPTVFTLTVPSVNGAVASPDATPVAVTS